MKKLIQKITLSLLFFVVQTGFSVAEDMDDFFAMSPEELANISVSIATGTAKPVYQSASMTSVITAQQIKSMGATELSQVLETVPGLHISIQGVTNDPMITMRGMRNNTNSEVLVMLNGTRYSVPYKGSSLTGMELPVEAIQQVEVIRGPGSAIYGADAFAGVINIITKKAKDIEGTEVGVRGGSWDTQSAWGLHSNQWLGWDIAATLQYAHNNNDGDRIVHSDLQTQFDANPALGTNASKAPREMQTSLERWNAHLNLQRKHWDVGFWAFNEVDGGLRAGASGAVDTEGELYGENYLLDTKFSTEDFFDDWELSAKVSYLYSNLDADIHGLPDATRVPIDSEGFINPTDFVGLTLFPDGVLSQIGIENQVVSFELSNIYKGFDDHLLRLITGFRYEQVHTQESRNFGKGIIDGTQAVVDGNLTNVTGTDLIFLPNSHRSIWSVALQDEWQMSEDWQLTAGVRYDHYSDFGSTVNPRVALVWAINQQLTSKLMYGQAFRSPSFLEQKQQNSQLFVGNPELEPETIETLELAFDYRPFSELRTAVNFYYYKIDDLISVRLDRNGDLNSDNLKGQTGYGSEVEWDWQFEEKWNLKGNYAWQYATDDETKQRVGIVPEHQVYTAITWRFLPQWQIQSQVNWIGSRLNVKGSNNKDLDDYQTVDITLNSKRFFGAIDFSASVRNVFDSDGKEAASNSYPDNLPIASRSFYLETSLHF